MIGKLVDMSRPGSFGCIMWLKRGVIQMGVKAKFTLRPVNEGETEVFCAAMEEGKRTIIGRLMKGQQRSFAENMFDLIKTRFKQLY